MKKLSILVMSFLLLNGFIPEASAQEEPRKTEEEPKKTQEEPKKSAEFSGLSGVTKNVIIGYAYSDFVINPKSDVKTNFTRVGFSPTMIWKLGEKLFFESQVEFYTDSGKVNTQVEYAKLSYIVNKYMTVGMGKILTPFGLYTERIEAPFIEKFPNSPLGFKHYESYPNIGPVGPEMGFDIRGGFQIGNSKMNYVFYMSNGARLNDGEEEKHLAGALEYENFFDNNSNKAFGGRIGYLPFHNSSLEIGGSWNICKPGDAKSEYAEVKAIAYSADITYHKTFKSIKSMVDFKSQINYLTLTEATYKDELDLPYTFTNNSYISYIRLSVRPALLHNKYLRRMEIMGRYNKAGLASGALWGGNHQRIDIGLAYWLSLRTGFRLAYEKGEEENGFKTEAILVRFVTGF